jgi:hypothetical protein
MNLETKQAAPEITELPESMSVQAMVLKDVATRMVIGKERYGTLLYPNNGRDMLRDAYEEALDLAVHLRGAIAERDGS